MKLVFILFISVALAYDSQILQSLQKVVSAKKTEKALVLPWVLSSSSIEPRSFCFVGDEFNTLASALKARGHTVETLLPSNLSSKEKTFGHSFGLSLAAFNNLKSKSYDVIVFGTTLGYVSIEAKRAGIAFSKTTIVVNVDQALLTAPTTYHDHIVYFLQTTSMELADGVFTSHAGFVNQLTFSSPVSVWSVTDMGISFLESVLSSKTTAVAVKTPLVSVIITSFNRPAMLQQAVESVKAQTYGGQIEIIVVDDGSTVAGMSEVLFGLERNGVVVHRQRNQYLGAARNAGAKIAKGAFLLFLDDDNIALKNMVSTLMYAAQHSSSKIAVNAHYVWHTKSDADAVPTDLSSLSSWCPVGPAVVAGIRGNVFGNANFMIEKDTFFALSGFTEDRTGWEDYEFHAKAAISGVSFVVVAEPLMLYRQHDHFEQMSAKTGTKANIKRVVRAYQHLLTEAKTSEEALHNFVDRGVTTCSAITFTDVNLACKDTILRVTTSGTSGFYGGVQVAPAVFFLNGTTVPLTYNVDYTFTAPAEQSNAGNWDIKFIESSQLFTSLLRTALLTGTSSLQVTFQQNTVSCGSIVINANQLPSCATVVCFHKDTIVEYDGELHGLESLRKHPSCAIPHVVKDLGVSIFTSCTPHKALRLTKDHLVYTSKGLVAAGDVQKGDVVFADLNQQHPCTVEKVEVDTVEQEFFGLNCLKSTVLANQIKTSTFGRLHTVPSVWMSWVGNAFGVKRASSWGDSIAHFARRMNIF